MTAATTRIAVAPEILDWAVKRHKLSDLEKKFPKLHEWRQGETQPTLNQLEQLATATHTPLGYFFLNTPPVETLPIPYFRTLDQTVPDASDDLLESVRNMKARQDWMREYLVDQGFEKVPVVGSAKSNEGTTTIASAIRNKLGMDGSWGSKFRSWTDALKDLASRVEDIEINVVSSGIVGNNTHRKLDPKEFRGFVLVDEYAPLIFINAADSKAAQMFSLAHEVAHVWVGASAAFDLRELSPANDATEIRCNAIAAEVLVPSQLLLKLWEQSPTKPSFEDIARYFKVSQLVAARRCLDLNLVSKATFLSFYREYQKSEHAITALSKSSGGDFYATQNQRIGRRFARAIHRAVKQGKLLYRDAYRLTGLTGKTFDSFFSENLR